MTDPRRLTDAALAAIGERDSDNDKPCSYLEQIDRGLQARSDRHALIGHIAWQAEQLAEAERIQEEQRLELVRLHYTAMPALADRGNHFEMQLATAPDPATVAAMREALEFYTDPKRYQVDLHDWPLRPAEIIRDGGQKARAALLGPAATKEGG